VCTDEDVGVPWELVEYVSAQCGADSTVAYFDGGGGRGLHSSTFQLNLSRVRSLKPQQASTSQLELRRFCR